MKILGIDIGTSSICGAVLTENGEVLSTETLKNEGTIPVNDGFSHIQDSEKILAACRGVYDAALKRHGRLDAVGFTGQMHGVLFLDGRGDPLSPLYTWQHKIAALAAEGGTYAEKLSAIAGRKVFAGYGAATAYALLQRNQLPAGAKRLCTIHAYAAMRFCRQSEPVLHASDAASLGVFDLAESRFDHAALTRAGLDASLFPAVYKDARFIGETAEGVPVCAAIGDNQASVLGSLPPDGVLVNVGTGSQVSAVADGYTETDKAELRPYFEGKYLLTGCALAGGYAYSLLENFFRETFCMFGVTPPQNLYPAMNAAANAAGPAPVTLPYFCGTRDDAARTAEIAGLNDKNFTPQALTRSFLDGVAEELFSMYENFSPLLQSPPKTLVGSGNGVRKNPLLARLFSEKFRLEIKTPLFCEEAAMGAALAALAAKTGVSVFETQKLLQYTKI
ncbi:MAG: hypothetical protein DBX59_00680 [Bacillota bacterium]|nr:MAG: hypothetical protein DBX59_00680 [Bacillota bacterium]